MTGRAGPIVAVGLCLVVGFSSACEGFAFNSPGRITVTNSSTTETAVLAIQADDVKSYPTLGPGASAVVTTTTGGAYTVTVVMAPEAALNYRASLLSLRRNLEKVVDGTASTEEKVLFFTHLAGVKVAIQQAENSGGGASCSGRIQLKEDEPVGVAAAVNWESSLGSGFWSITCGSAD